ncbi:MAG: GMC family oxidoreductase [Archangium sp.]|nr:GMC family oxidoreductase [Archangium sp.]MDP3157952.1 GMC family oxidoreductase [Archangium sp.]MDP3574480.1 GMC family oxidoreductase [Archangium sp.]
MAKDSVDVCIIGSGAGGAPLALELGRAGFKVVVLEKGAWYQQADFVHDEIMNSRRNFFMPLPWDEPHLWRTEGQPYARTNEAWTANCVGGGTVHMSGYFYRLKPIDFRQKTELGAPKGSNVVDWPITYKDLAPYYDKAEAELGVSGNAVPHPFAEPRSGNYPLPPLAEHPVSAEIDKAAKSLGWHAIPTARGILSKPYRGRDACVYCTLCGSYGCEHGAKSSTAASLIPAAIATGNVELRPKCMAKEITVDAKGLAKSVIYLDADGVEQEQPARIIVSSCTAVESARLLLNSKSSRFPNGLGNDNGLVGKNLLFSSFGQSKATFSVAKRGAELPWLTANMPFVNRSLQDFYVMPDDRFGFRKGGTLGFMWAHPNPIFAAVGIARKGENGVFGKALKDKLRTYRDSRVLEFEIYGEFLSNDSTYVGVDPNVKDKFGLPVAAITIKRHPLDFTMTKFLVDRGEEVLQAMNPDKVDRVGTAGETTILQGGTCRFGKDAATSVLDADCRSHVVKNLYVVDGSFLPTSGGVPLTLTIAANSFRVAQKMVASLKK